MDDLISREMAINCAIDAIDDWDGGWNPNREVVIRKYFEELPAVDAMIVRHGRWINHKDEHQCSECKEITIVDFYVWRNVQFDYCPYCGARMDGDNDDE